MKRHKEVSKWRDKIKLSDEYREDYGYSNHWSRYQSYYTNEWKPGIVPVNMVFAIARSIVPRVYFRNPRVIVSPTKPGTDIMSNIVESLDNWLIHRIRIKKEMKKIVLDTFLRGTGILKTGYDSEYGYTSAEDARENTEIEQEYLERYENYINPNENRNEYNTNIVPGLPWAKRVHPADFGVPWGYDEIHNSPWVFHKFMRHVDDVKDDPKYENTKDLKATHRVKAVGEKDEDTNSLASNRKTEARNDKYVLMYEISDLRDGKVKTIAKGHSKFLRNTEDPLIRNGHKYFALKWNENSEAFWGIPDTRIIEPQQLELNEIRTQYKEHRKLSILKLLVEKGVLNDEALEQLKSGDIGAVVEVDDSPGNVIEQLKPHLTNELLTASNEIRRDIRETVGFSRNQMGDFDTSSRRTAQEAKIVQQASQIRVDERRDMAADMLVDATERLNQYIFQFWDRPRVQRVIGPQSAARWVRFTGEQIRGEYDMRVDADSARAVTSETRKQEAIELLQLFGQYAEAMPDRINLGELLRYIGEQYEGINVDRIINEPQPQQVGGMQNPMGLEQLIQAQGQGQQQSPRGQSGAQPNVGQMIQALSQQGGSQ